MSGRQPEAASDLAKLTPAVMWFAGASANFPSPCPYPLPARPPFNQCGVASPPTKDDTRDRGGFDNSDA